ncbi:ap endonuclease [Anaeramoeba ignava]|uniref:Ap endonuclease n=1 Tax=Anaeramoeba ignava TaxID=1746090 RepID=A0A9Q0LKF4_ANAIG|nr:ap endonuclease [Anaeramoeba ignava]
MVNWGNLHIFADSPFINIYQILNILKNYYPLRGYWRRVNNTSQGHFQVVYPHRAVREKWRVILRGIKIAISISKPKKKRNFEKKRNKIKQENKVKEDNKETQINTLDASNEIIESETEYILDESSENESEEIDEPNVSVKLTDTKELTQEETICYKNLDSHNWLKTPLILKAQYENSPIKNEEKFQVISNQIEEIITEELKILPKKKIGEADLREFLSKSINYSYKRSFQKYNPYTKKQMKPFQDKIIKKFINKEWEIDSNLKQTIKYKNSKDYTEMNTKKITKIRNSNKIIIQRSFLNIFETLSILNNQYVHRIIQKGEHQMEIWDKNQMINSIFQNCKQKQENIPTKTKIHLINANGDKIETVKGKQEMNDNEYTTNIGSININGLIRLGKTQELEQILLEQKIEIALIQESHLKKRIYFQKYFTFEKEAYGQKKSKGGIAIAVRKEIRKYFHEIPNEDSDILHLKISDMNIITVYIRNKRQNELMKKLQEIIQNLNGEKFIIGGDFNLTEEEINKRKLLPNVVIIPNPENSRTRNIDHFCVNEGIITQPSKIFDTISRKLSDHKLIITSIRIKIPQITTLQYYQPTREEFQIKLLKKVEEETEIGDKLILKPSIIQNLKENFKKRVIVHTETQDKIGFELLNFTQQEKPNWKKMLRKKWKKTIKGIEMDKMNEINYWTEIQRLTQKKKPIKTDPEMRERFKRMIEQIRRHPTETIIQKIKNYEIDIPEDVRKPSLIFPLERLNQTIKMSKNSATCEYDKIDSYKNPYIEENTEKYEEIIKLINRMYKKWIKNPDETTINYLRKRRMIFIFKQGDAENKWGLGED